MDYMSTIEYRIFRLGDDFQYARDRITLTGKRTKVLVDVGGDKAILKYPPFNYNTSEISSEKIAYELAKELGFECARAELAQGEDGTMGILNFLFTSPPKVTHTDAGAYLKTVDSSRSSFYTLSNIKSVLDDLGDNLFCDFVRTMVFDALIGEQDRHEDNWGILSGNGNGVLRISPLYDNGCSLVRDFADENKIAEYESGRKNFEDYINRSKTLLYKELEYLVEGESMRYGHFELIDRLIKSHSELVEDVLSNITSLNDERIKSIVNRIPMQLLTECHKTYIIKYIVTRKQKLTEKYIKLQARRINEEI